MTRAALLCVLLATSSTGVVAQRADWGLPPVREAAARPWLGIIVTGLEDSEGAAESDSSSPGLSIARVAPRSPAEAAGLEAGDVLLAIDGQIMKSPASLVALMKQRAPGSRLVASMLREGAVEQVSILLGEQPAGWDAVKRVIAAVPPGDELPEEEVDDVLLKFAGHEARPSLGIDTMELEPGLARYFGVPEGEGVLVEQVEPGSPAARAGIAAGDVLVAVAGRTVESGADVTDALQSLLPGAMVDVAWLRAGSRLGATIALQSRQVPVWTADVDGADRSAPLAELADHHRREARRLEELLQGAEKGDTDLKPYLERSTDSAAEIAALRKELAALKARLAELEAERAKQKPAGATPRSSPSSR